MYLTKRHHKTINIYIYYNFLRFLYGNIMKMKNFNRKVWDTALQRSHSLKVTSALFTCSAIS